MYTIKSNWFLLRKYVTYYMYNAKQYTDSAIYG